MLLELVIAAQLDINLTTMDDENKARLYLELKKEIFTSKRCRQCENQFSLDCEHLTARQCARLQPAREDTKDDGGGTRVYKCGHAYLARRRIRSKPMPFRKGAYCSTCLRMLVWNERTTRLGKPQGAKRPKRPKQPTKDNGKKQFIRPRRRLGAPSLWVRRGLMLGKEELGGKRSVLF